MNIALCLDYASFTEKYLETAKYFIDSISEPQVSVIHIIDETLFYSTTGVEKQLDEDLQNECRILKELSEKYLGKNVNYIEEYGIPKLKIDEVLAEMNYDLLIVGNHSRSTLGGRLLGGIAEHLLRTAAKPVLVIK